MVDKQILHVEFNGRIFIEYLTPNGYLINDPACHGLFYYYLIARKNLEQYEIDPIIYEDEPWPDINFKQLFSSIAIAYGVEPERMTKFWVNVDMQCDVLNLPRLPGDERIRFNKVAEIRTQ